MRLWRLIFQSSETANRRDGDLSARALADSKVHLRADTPTRWHPGTWRIVFPGCTFLGLAFVAITLMVLGTACSKPKTGGKPADVDYYTCTMHPSVKRQDPKDKCPICSMDLTPVKRKADATSDAGQPAAGHDHAKMLAEQATHGKSDSDMPSEFTVPVERQQMIGVTYAPVQRKALQLSIRTVGVVAYDKLRHWDFVVRVDGYVGKLYVGSKGELVEKDQPLVSIYSPDLLTTQRELVDLLRLRDQAKESGAPSAGESTERLIESAKRRLRLWNITDAQLEDLEKSRQPQETLTLNSPFRGVVQNIQVDQGRKVMSGDHLVDVADLSVVWVWAEFYQEELPLLTTNLPVTVTSSASPGEKFTGHLAVIDPFLNDAKRTVRARLEVENPHLKLRPDLYVDVEVGLDMGQGLTVPFHAVLPTGRRNIVFVDKGEGRLEPRFVELGRKFGDDYQVTEGLKAGERVVTSANFLIDAEAKVQGALKSW